MQRPTLKANTREADPNPYITFIRALENKSDSSDAEHILKAVAAQMKRIMERRFMQVGTLEEAAYNGVYAGRNWNHGQTIELVLRRPNGKFLPLRYIVSTMCHEMAHITHMNHGPEFKKLNAAIKADVAAMQRKGNYGDGFWSDGKRLGDSAKMGRQSGLKRSDFPEYICGVTASDAKRGKGSRSRRPASNRATGLVKGEASHRSGRQTEYRRKAGRANNVDMGESQGRLDGRREITAADREARQTYIDKKVMELRRTGLDIAKAKRRAAEMFDKEHPWFREGSTRGKVAKSKSAAELRAVAAERRLAMISGVKKEEEEDELDPESAEEKPQLSEDDEDEDDDIVEIEDPHLSVEDRKREMEHDMTAQERTELRGGWEDFVKQEDTPRSSAGPSRGQTPSPKSSTRLASPAGAIDSDSDDDVVFMGSAPGLTSKRAKLEPADSDHDRPGKRVAIRANSPDDAPRASASANAPNFGTGIVHQERLRALGLAGGSVQATGGRSGIPSNRRTGRPGSATTHGGDGDGN